MKIKCFKNGFRNQRKINFIGKKLNLRIATHQLAFWIKDKAIFNLMF